ncbi:hypothetical protein [Staphylococcus phage vB_SauH_DELF3]|nr:hypothetical protein [Staphylococcus phage vB_SauH_DELF3]
MSVLINTVVVSSLYTGEGWSDKFKLAAGQFHLKLGYLIYVKGTSTTRIKRGFIMEELVVLYKLSQNKSACGRFTCSRGIRTTSDKYISRVFLEGTLAVCCIILYDDMSEYEVVVRGTGQVIIYFTKDVLNNMPGNIAYEYDNYLIDSASQKYNSNITEEQVAPYK